MSSSTPSRAALPVSLAGTCLAPVSPARSHSSHWGQVQVVNPLADPAWDESVRAHADACFFHGSAWAGVLHRTYGQTPLYYAVRDGTALTALLPVVEIDSRLTGRRGVSLPFTDYCPPLRSDKIRFADLLQEVIAQGVQRRWRYLEVRGGFELLEGIPSFMSFHGHVLDLSVGEAALLKGFEGRVRNAVRKAESLGVQVEISAEARALDDFFRLHCQTRRKHGVPVQPRRFFDNICHQILDHRQGIVAVARFRDAPVAAAVFFHFGKRVIYKYSASSQDAQQVRPNNLLMWEAIRWYAHAGAAEMHFGRTSLANEGLRLYKRGFHTTEQRIDYIRYDYRRQCFLAGAEKPPGLVNRVCRLLPVPLLRLAGRLLYKHVA